MIRTKTPTHKEIAMLASRVTQAVFCPVDNDKGVLWNYGQKYSWEDYGVLQIINIARLLDIDVYRRGLNIHDSDGEVYPLEDMIHDSNAQEHILLLTGK